MTTFNEIRVVIVDDHDIVRRGLSMYLKATSDIKMVGEAGNGLKGIQVCEETQPDVVLMDLFMPKMDGIEAIREIHKLHPHIRILALTSFQDKELVRKALSEGAMGYLLKNVTGEDLAKAIRFAMEGKPTLSPEVTQDFILNTRNPGPEETLTSREKEVLLLLVDGLSNPEIAQQLTISRSTARAHVSHIIAKLGVTNRAEAIAKALRGGLVR
ncbi:MAG: response regulator transcription factor [Anaerolineaceae bacterium]|nr:response regulator transcription factor [Anaerolineaceae bacterium]